ncbi:sugar phosphate isomerase/epimerase [Fulvivirga maritima]|uniref:sugar phosphate isomerase/epimerase family protein n=1 Tax=Fulvivirga maritima TaxID=2904247 RepID=UPI001F2240EC|nr:sugar phosphate isomerase/epimerase family protein [Fulvivirga maritima]UII25954.1 sugar phosphate isomerase/epimerase [Fulvivirga maritima]
MKLGTVSWTFGIEDLEELFKTVKSLGYEAIQFCGDFRTYPAPQVAEIAEKYEIEITGYDIINCQPRNETDATLAHSVSFYKQVINYASQIGTDMVTVQGLSFWTTDAQNYQEAFDQIVEAVRQLANYAAEKDITLTYEACNHYEVPWIHTAEELIKLKRESAADNLKLVLDSFHMNINEKDAEASIEKVGVNDLFSYHVSDSGRGGIGTGHINFKAHYDKLKAIGFDGLICFEIVVPECRPDKLPMNDAQMDEFLQQHQHSLATWKDYLN